MARTALEPLDRQGSGEAPYQLQYELQDLMQDQVGIVRNDGELRSALEALQRLQERVERVEAQGNREYNAGWHTALDLRNLMMVAEAVTRVRHRAQGEPRRPLPRGPPRQGRGMGQDHARHQAG